MLFENELDTEEPEDFEAGQEIGGERENESLPDISEHEEAVAKARGWVPKDSFRGKEEDWQDAKSFLDRNSSLKADVETLQERLNRQEEEYQERLRRIETASERIIENDRKRLIDQLEEAKLAAVELGDTDEYKRLKERESQYYRKIAEEAREFEPRKPEREQAPDLLPETQEWIRRNSWFKETASMRQIALGFYDEALEGMPATRDEGKRLAYVEKRMAQVYPDKFGERRQSSSVEGGGRSMREMSKTTQLSADERAACKRFIAKGLIKDEAEYIKYLNE